MAQKLYKMDISSCCRSVFLTAKALDMTLEPVEINLLKGEQFRPNFLKINPRGKVPVLDDGGQIICDSHAINIYLVRKYGRSDALYPKDPVQQALVNEWLHIDSGEVFPLVNRTSRQLYATKMISDESIKQIHQIFEMLEKNLQDKKWITGENITLADFSLLSTTATLNCYVPIDIVKYPKIIQWFKRAEECSFYDVVKKGIEELKISVDKIKCLNINKKL